MVGDHNTSERTGIISISQSSMGDNLSRTVELSPTADSHPAIVEPSPHLTSTSATEVFVPSQLEIPQSKYDWAMDHFIRYRHYTDNPENLCKKRCLAN